MKTSCGFIILHKGTQEFLLGKVTNWKEYSIPKGGINSEESFLDCAFRETQEESGISKEFLKSFPIYDLGEFVYSNRKKRLMCFLCVIDTKPEKLFCDSTFTNERGQTLPEMDGFVWSSLDCELPIHDTQRQALLKVKSILGI